MESAIPTRSLLLALTITLACSALAAAQTITSVKDSAEFKWSGEVAIVRVAKSPGKGFHYPYLLRIPAEPRTEHLRLLVEPNNTGTATDDFEAHEDSARKLISRSYATRIADRLHVPMLIPVFPRPRSDWRAYTHSLDDDTLRIAEGPNQRIDLQLRAMIEDARQLLKNNQLEVADGILMHGFSASGTFSNRFAAIHPELVRAVASGSVKAIPLIPAAELAGEKLPYPIGLHDLEELTGEAFDRDAYRRVSQFIYMGASDRNDTTEYRDAFSEEHANLIHELIGKEMPDRWLRCREIHEGLGIPAQLVTYNATGHTIRDEMLDDVVRFFEANMGSERKVITPHQYPYAEFQELKQVHVSGLHWRGSQELPEFARGLWEGRGTFAICIEDWIEGQDWQQMESFRKRGGFHFQLTGEDDVVIEITEANYSGSMSQGDGSFQAFLVAPTLEDTKKLKPGKYRLKPLGDSRDFWVIKEGVQLIVPADQ